MDVQVNGISSALLFTPLISRFFSRCLFFSFDTITESKKLCFDDYFKFEVKKKKEKKNRGKIREIVWRNCCICVLNGKRHLNLNQCNVVTKDIDKKFVKSKELKIRLKISH